MAISPSSLKWKARMLKIASNRLRPPNAADAFSTNANPRVRGDVKKNQAPMPTAQAATAPIATLIGKERRITWQPNTEDGQPGSTITPGST